jgi:hypothetical protein
MSHISPNIYPTHEPHRSLDLTCTPALSNLTVYMHSISRMSGHASYTSARMVVLVLATSNLMVLTSDSICTVSYHGLLQWYVYISLSCHFYFTLYLHCRLLERPQSTCPKISLTSTACMIALPLHQGRVVKQAHHRLFLQVHHHLPLNRPCPWYPPSSQPRPRRLYHLLLSPQFHIFLISKFLLSPHCF